jgi:hypothetical protein
MLSVEPWTIRGCGYPNLLATGETCLGDTIHDRQHPHDLFMEIAASYQRPLTESLRWEVYGGPAGEPALGPPAFPHRLSASGNPIAPITHHWLDSSHITFGVVTAGVFSPRWKFEASAFNGREPDDQRTGFDLNALDSVSGRVSFMPTPRLVAQVSAGHLRAAEAGLGTQPRRDVERITASISYHRPFGAAMWATTVAYGLDSGVDVIREETLRFTTSGVLAETTVAPDNAQTWFGRLEIVAKPAHDLHADEYRAQVFTVGKLEAGYVRYFVRRYGLDCGLGGTLTLSALPPELAPRYAGRIAPGFGVFLNLRPAAP